MKYGADGEGRLGVVGADIDSEQAKVGEDENVTAEEGEEKGVKSDKTREGDDA